MSEVQTQLKNVQIADKIKLGVFSLVKAEKNGKPLKSKIFEYNSFMKIRDESRNIVQQKLACVICQKVYDYNRSKGTGNLLAHKKRCSKRNEKIEGTNFSQADVGKMKTEIADVVVKYVCQDLRPFSCVEDSGFLHLANALIQIGAQHGNVSAETILSHPTTISKRLSEVAESKRNELKLCLEEKTKQGIAVTVDIWTDDFKRRPYLGMSVHYIEAGSVVERTLTIKEITGQTGHNICEELTEELIQNGVNIENVIFVTDRGGEFSL